MSAPDLPCPAKGATNGRPVLSALVLVIGALALLITLVAVPVRNLTVPAYFQSPVGWRGMLVLVHLVRA